MREYKMGERKLGRQTEHKTQAGKCNPSQAKQTSGKHWNGRFNVLDTGNASNWQQHKSCCLQHQLQLLLLLQLFSSNFSCNSRSKSASLLQLNHMQRRGKPKTVALKSSALQSLNHGRQQQQQRPHQKQQFKWQQHCQLYSCCNMGVALATAAAVNFQLSGL